MIGLGVFLINDAMTSMKETSNNIDDARSVSATRSAIQAVKKQLGATVRDNAYWDDAYAKMNEPDAVAWATENWGVTTENYPLYDTAVVVAPDGTALIGFHNGIPIKDTDLFFGSSFKALLKAARAPDPKRERLPVAFIQTTKGLALIGASAIQPYEDNPEADRAKFKVLVFAKHFGPEVIAEMAKNFSISGLSFEDRPGHLHARLTDIGGRLVGQLTWPAQEPGTRSFISVKPKAFAAALVLFVLLSAICAAALLAVRNVRREERRSHYDATHDSLTGLHNRAGLLEQIDLSIAHLNEAKPSEIDLHLIDLDGFKGVNDAWGHAVGDQLIIAVARRIVDFLPRNVIAARLGGDEFAILSQSSSQQSLETISSNILNLFDQPFDIDGRQMEIGGSVGAASTTNSQIEREELFRRSDLALYRAKELGRGISVTFEPGLDAAAREAADLEQDIRAAISKREFSVAFQPLIDAKSGTMCGVEALARWVSPARGRVAPDVFIAAAEKCGLIDLLGMQILELAVKAASPWLEVGLSVNASPLQFRNPLFVDELIGTLRRYGFEPNRLTLEVTEGILISNTVQVKRAFQMLKTHGVKIALDDFGCGYASIGALREFGFDRMKVDRSLVVAAETEGNGGAVLQATIALANALNIPATAEGIETESQAAVVKLCGCDELQGYLYGKPTTEEELALRYFAKEAAA
ncbi:EAL domain-containing protein [Rhizobium sp. TH2]|uniref:bifunctional diguanylate cyclase/phosphodiesterase n=1 Tax=Rhizobium sp. TH2 TaxID=2775403 RepID=UPI0021571360|nr:EAL domain-containing protein [Rhizobium sp. TH2]UVC08222.1 EAL domain-containing protein [Rhizobium sp. TH2]